LAQLLHARAAQYRTTIAQANQTIQTLEQKLAENTATYESLLAALQEQNRHHAHKRFCRADKARTRQVEGVGPGLSLVESIVEVYGGRFTIDSADLGTSTTVRVWWPISQRA
jgi:light-regulated signal transduction histidine kinase (bacteriophytochrome)